MDKQSTISIVRLGECPAKCVICAWGMEFALSTNKLDPPKILLLLTKALSALSNVLYDSSHSAR